MRLTSTFEARARRVAGEVVRFLLVGGLATVVSVVGFNALVHGFLVGHALLDHHPVTAYVLVNFAAGWVAYVGMRVWAFRNRDMSNPRMGLVSFFGLGALTMVIPVLCLWFSRYGLGLSSPLADNLSANVVGLSLGAGARFWIFRQLVFDTPVPQSSPGVG